MSPLIAPAPDYDANKALDDLRFLCKMVADYADEREKEPSNSQLLVIIAGIGAAISVQLETLDEFLKLGGDLPVDWDGTHRRQA